MKKDQVLDDRLLMVFVKNPDLGKVKTRLAATVGDEKALEVYKRLLAHTRDISLSVKAKRAVYYHERIAEDDLWTHDDFQKHLQLGGSLGEKMLDAFKNAFEGEYQKVIIIGSDCIEINAEIINYAFNSLDTNDTVVGPAQDGGYYLLGMQKLHPMLFCNKGWSKKDVLLDTVCDLKNEGLSFELLDTLSDVDVESDLQTAGLQL
ncbi:MAG: TIGR04282 family arsenosugar biosynthesis glycosyltransferase [Flavobacteriales bacterium]|nr:TIGR04282 family arsenosugar biosynthesis glycosyltransferase [Flavobacteriales bacterium]